MNIWRHVRLAGALVIIVGACVTRQDMVFLGLLIQFVGVIGGLNRTEDQIESLLEKFEKEDDNAVR